MEKLSENELSQLYELINLEPYTNQNRYEYLVQALQRYQDEVPFSNIFLLSTPVSDRRPLTFQEIKQLILSGQGGFCQVMNCFFWSFLLTIGYEADLVNSAYSKSPDTHSVIIVHNVCKQGDRFMVDVGSGFYQSAIELNFEDKSPIYHFLYSTCYLQWDEKKENIIKYNVDKNGEASHLLAFTLKPFTDFNSLSLQNHIYTNPKSTPFHTNLRIMRFPQTGAVCVVNQSLLKENAEHRLKPAIEKFVNSQDFVNNVKKIFPRLNLDKCKVGYEGLYPESPRL